MTDKNDSDQDLTLKKFAKVTVELAEEYAAARTDYAKAKLTLDCLLADAYKAYKVDPKTGIKDGLAMEKAYLMLMNLESNAKGAYNKMMVEEQNYKGLERILDARKGYTYLTQDINKNQARLKS